MNEVGQKLDFKYKGSYRIDRIDDNGNVVKVGKNNKKQTVHQDRLKIYNALVPKIFITQINKNISTLISTRKKKEKRRKLNSKLESKIK